MPPGGRGRGRGQGNWGPPGGEMTFSIPTHKCGLVIGRGKCLLCFLTSPQQSWADVNKASDYTSIFPFRWRKCKSHKSADRSLCRNIPAATTQWGPQLQTVHNPGLTSADWSCQAAHRGKDWGSCPLSPHVDVVGHLVSSMITPMDRMV